MRMKHLKEVMINISAFPIILLGYVYPKKVFAREHDFLDHFFVLEKLWSEQVPFFNYSIRIQGVLDNINPNALGFADLNPTLILGKFFDPTLTFAISEVTLRFFGFMGFYFLVKTVTNCRESKIPYLGALIFSSLDLIPTYEPTVFLTPIFFLMLLQVLKSQFKLVYYPILFIIWQWMGVVYGGFVLLIILVSIIFTNFKKRDAKLSEYLRFVAWNIFFALFAIHRLFVWQIQSEGKTQRTDWPKQLDTSNLIPSIAKDFIQAISLPYLNGMNIALIVLWIVLYFFARDRKIDLRSSELKMMYIYFIAILLALIEVKMKILAGMGFFFQLNRVSVFLPFVLLYFLATKTCDLPDLKLKRLGDKSAATILVIILVSFPQPYNLLRNSILDSVSDSPRILKSFASFMNYSTEDTFSLSEKFQQRKAVTISEKFQMEKYSTILSKIGGKNAMPRVLSVGLDPMVASYNGFRSFDGYVFNYELSYKRKFRPIIEEVLENDPQIRDYFDDWGNRVYTFTQNNGASLLDLCYAKSIGVDYILFPLGDLTDPRIQPVLSSNLLAAGRIRCGQ